MPFIVMCIEDWTAVSACCFLLLWCKLVIVHCKLAPRHKLELDLTQNRHKRAMLMICLLYLFISCFYAKF